MTLEDQHIRLLTFLAKELRPSHAPHAEWDEAGIAACISKVRHLSLAEVARAVINAASDKTAKTPGLIADLSSSAWRDKPAEPRERHMHPPKAHEVCSDHGGWRENCPGCKADELAGDAPIRHQHTKPADPERVRQIVQTFHETRTEPAREGDD